MTRFRMSESRFVILSSQGFRPSFPLYTCRRAARPDQGSRRSRVLVARPLLGTVRLFVIPVVVSQPRRMIRLWRLACRRWPAPEDLPAMAVLTMPVPARWITGPGREIVAARQPNSHGLL